LLAAERRRRREVAERRQQEVVETAVALGEPSEEPGAYLEEPTYLEDKEGEGSWTPGAYLEDKEGEGSWKPAASLSPSTMGS
jgi:hypothetical protein